MSMLKKRPINGQEKIHIWNVIATLNISSNKMWRPFDPLMRFDIWRQDAIKRLRWNEIAM